jgi:outer membrane lipoprotein SlyB
MTTMKMSTKTSTKIGILAMLALLSVACGCASPGLGGGSYSREQTRREQTVRMGYVESVREVKLEGTRSGVGPVAGAVVGGVAGSTIGHGRGSVIGAVVGAVAGGVAGQVVEQGVTTKRGVEVTVKLDNGQMVAIMQEADETFRPGDRVRILSDGATSRVTR